MKYFNPQIALLGAGVMGGIVYYVNHDHGFDNASIAALKQSVYTFFVGGVMTGLCESIVSSSKISKKKAAYYSVIIPSIATIGLTYLVHSLKGTPKPLESTIPTIILAPPGFVLISRLKKNKLERELEN